MLPAYRANFSGENEVRVVWGLARVVGETSRSNSLTPVLNLSAGPWGWRFLPWILLTDLTTEGATSTLGNYHKSNLLLELGGGLWGLYLQGGSRIAGRAWSGI